MVYDVINTRIRGEHAHRSCHQFIVCAKGSCAFVADDGTNREEFMLENPTMGIYVPPLVWGVQYKHSSDAVTIVFASEFYDPKDYIRDYDDFLHIIAARS
jgi:dTDP-4-dehydrorhamnose 3,5-epimerase-like enzyme